MTIPRISLSTSSSERLAPSMRVEAPVEAIFEKEYEKMPLITASIAVGDKDENFTDRKTEEREGAQEALEQSLLQNNIQYIITRRTTKGFIIKLSESAPENITFSWVAVAVKDAKTVASPAEATSSAH